MIGHGGMGAVYRARQISLDRLVAIKILPPEAADDETQFIQRFKNEARTMAKLSHPAIVTVFDFGETAEGQLYFVMEFVDGTDVAQMVRSQGRLPPDHALAISAHVCDALQYAHEHGVIHRDIKPANILINQEGQVKVADFGLAKIEDPSGTTGLTRSSMSMGTPDFVAPEALTLGMVADHRADLYAVGVMLYEMLTGEIPRGVFKVPSQKCGCDARFDAIVLKAMETDREDRYQSAYEIRQHLDEILTVPLASADEGSASSATLAKSAAPGRGSPSLHHGPPPDSAVASSGLQRNQNPIIPIAIATGSLLCIGGIFLFGGIEPPPPQAAGGSATAKNRNVSNRTPKPAPPSKAPGPIVVKAKAPAPPVPPAGPVAPPVLPSSKVDTAKPVQLAAPSPARSLAPNAAPVPAMQAPGGPLRATDALAVPPAPAASVPEVVAAPAVPELLQLQQQFDALQKERVIAVYTADLAKLNAGYLGGIDRSIADEKRDGHLDGVLAVEDERKNLGAGIPVPATDAANAPDSLKKIRGIYRTSLAALEQQRMANHSAIVDPYTARLKVLESDLTKKDRIADARAVRDYREGLAKGQGPTLAATAPAPVPPAPDLGRGVSSKSVAGASGLPRKFPPGDDRKAAEWALSLGGSVDIFVDNKVIKVASKTDLPKGGWEVRKIAIDKNKPAGPATGTYVDLSPIAGLKKLEGLELYFLPVADQDTDILATLTSLRSLRIYEARTTFTGRQFGLLADLPDLGSLVILRCDIDSEGMRQIGMLSNLTMLTLKLCEKIKDRDMKSLASLKKLESFGAGGTDITPAGLELAGLKNVTGLGWTLKPGKVVKEMSELAGAFPALERLEIDFQENVSADEWASLGTLPKLWRVLMASAKADDATLTGLGRIPGLVDIQTQGKPIVTSKGVEALLNLKKLATLRMEAAPALTPKALTSLATLRSLKKLEIPGCDGIGDAAIAAFKKERPDVQVIVK